MEHYGPFGIKDTSRQRFMILEEVLKYELFNTCRRTNCNQENLYLLLHFVVGRQMWIVYVSRDEYSTDLVPLTSGYWQMSDDCRSNLFYPPDYNSA